MLSSDLSLPKQQCFLCCFPAGQCLWIIYTTYVEHPLPHMAFPLMSQIYQLAVMDQQKNSVRSLAWCNLNPPWALLNISENKKGGNLQVWLATKGSIKIACLVETTDRSRYQPVCLTSILRWMKEKTFLSRVTYIPLQSSGNWCSENTEGLKQWAWEFRAWWVAGYYISQLPVHSLQ